MDGVEGIIPLAEDPVDGLEPLQPLDQEWFDETIRIQPAIELRGLGYKQSHEDVLYDIDLTIPEGDCFGIAGPSGSGKSALLRILLGLISPSSGSVEIFSSRIIPSLRRHLPVGYLSQSNEIPKDTPATVMEYIRLGLYPRKRFLRSTNPTLLMYAKTLLTAFHIDHYCHHPVGHLSPGNIQKVRLIRAMVSQPRLLILDEPFQHLDPQGRKCVKRLLSDLRRRSDVTIVMAAQDGGPMASVCQNLACLNRTILWTSRSDAISNDVWMDPCRYIPERDDDGHEELRKKRHRSRRRIRSIAPSQTIQFWR